MELPPRRRRWVMTGRIVAVLVLAGLAGYLSWIGLDDADKLSSCLSLLVAVAAFAAPYLLPSPSSGGLVSEPDVVEDSGEARAAGGATANSGVQVAEGSAPAQARRTGAATADGPGSQANTGIRRG